MTDVYDPAVHGSTPGLPDDAYSHDGLITKRHVRASALAFLRPTAGALLWDLGAGSGAVGIEWALAANTARAIGIEVKDERLARARANAKAFHVADRVEFKAGRIADLINTLPTPDAIFIGGGTSADLIEQCWMVLNRSGRIVAHAVTLETEQFLIDAYRTYGGDLNRISVEVVDPIGTYLGWKALRPVVQWAAIKS